MQQPKKSWIKLLWYIITYVVDLFKQKNSAEIAQANQNNSNLQSEYDKIDVALQNEQDKINNSTIQDVANQLNNKF